jgi:hypothetical protein
MGEIRVARVLNEAISQTVGDGVSLIEPTRWPILLRPPEALSLVLREENLIDEDSHEPGN